MKKDMCYIKACAAFGNGDIAKGKALFFEMAEALNVERIKHTAEEWKAGGTYGAIKALYGECEETIEALEEGGVVKRIHEEAIDLCVVAIRARNGEYL